MWEKKFDNNVQRFERRFELCGFYDENQLPHGGQNQPSPWYPTNHQRFRQVGSTICFNLQTSTSQTSRTFQQMVRSIDFQNPSQLRRIISKLICQCYKIFLLYINQCS